MAVSGERKPKECPKVMLQTLEDDLWNGIFFESPQERCLTWGHIAQDSRQLQSRLPLLWSEDGGSLTWRPTICSKSDVTDLKEVSVRARMHIYVLPCNVLAAIPVQSAQQK